MKSSTSFLDYLKLYKEVPYDISCPSVKDNIKRFICTKCNIYIASIGKLKDHYSFCKNSHRIPKIKPTRIAARRQKEILAATINLENEEELEWFDEDCLDTSNFDVDIIENKKKNESTAPLISINQNLQNLWEKA